MIISPLSRFMEKNIKKWLLENYEYQPQIYVVLYVNMIAIFTTILFSAYKIYYSMNFI